MNPNAPNSPQVTPVASLQTTSNAPPRFLFSLMFLVWLTVVLVTVLVTWILPESYVSTARIKIEPDAFDVTGLAERPTRLGFDPYFLQTELETIQSELILGKVVDLLDLNTVWGRKYQGGEKLKTSETLLILKGKMRLSPVRNTSLLAITVFSEDRDEAAKIANAVAEVYRDHRQERLRLMAMGGVKALEQGYQENLAKLHALQTQRESLAREQSSQNSNRWDEIKSEHNRLQRLDQVLFNRMLYMKIAGEKVDSQLPGTSMVEIVDRAAPGLRPIRPNKPLNITVGIFLGGIVGLFLATLLFLLQRRAFRQRSGVGSAPMPRWFRNILHVIIALVVGIIIGYNCAMPWSVGNLFLMQLSVVIGGIASAFIELAKVPETPQQTQSSNVSARW